MNTRRILAALLLAATVLLGLTGTAQAVQTPGDPGPGGSTADLGDPFFWKLAPGTEFSAQQRAHLYEVGDRVCEGFWAGVPMTDLDRGVAADLGVSLADARHFVTVALDWHC
jgi:hypothetical protein